MSGLVHRRARRLDVPDAADIVERILDGAANLIAAIGVDGMTMSTLADAADVSLPSVYRYFSSKRAIVESLALRYAERVRVELVAAIGPVTDQAGARAAVAGAMSAYWQLYRDDPAFPAVWSATAADPALATLDVDDSRRNGALLASALRDVSHPPDTDLDLRAFAASHLAGSIVRLAVQLDAEEADALIAAMVERVLPALLGLDDRRPTAADVGGASASHLGPAEAEGLDGQSEHGGG